MLYADEIMQARQYMGYQCIGKHKCVSCGLPESANNRISKTLKTNFVNFNELMIGSGMYICDACKTLLEDKDMRFKAVFYEVIGEKQLPNREDILGIIADPPEEFVLSLPYSFKKHHWLFAGLSNRSRALIGTDDRTVVIDYKRNDVKNGIEIVRDMINSGVPRKEIITGHYSTFTRYREKNIDEYENVLSQLRPSGAVELFVRYTPALTKTKKEREEGDSMITEMEWKAAEILLSIAIRSSVRAKDGMMFWGGYFERRINRLKELKLHEFVSRLSDAVGAQMAYVEGIEGIEDEEKEQRIMKEIRDKTNLIVSLAYTLLRERNENR